MISQSPASAAPPAHPHSHVAEIKFCHNPIFIIGCDRSGTTILARSLAQHSELWASLETDVLYDLYGNGHAEQAFSRAINRPNGSWLKTQDVNKSEFLEALGIGLNALFTKRSHGKRWIDHTPGYTPMVEILSEMFPGAKFLHILRDGRRVVNSMVNILSTFSDNGRKQMEEAGYLPTYVNFENACNRWSYFVETAMDFGRRYPHKCLTVSNEKMISQPEEMFSDIFTFINVSFETSPIEFFRNNRINSSFRRDSLDPNWVKDLSDPWKEWTSEQRRMFRDAAGATLVRYNMVNPEEISLSEYDQVVLSIRDCVTRLPCNTKVAVISKGDPQLVELGSVQGFHFPHDELGQYFGGHPADSGVAKLQLQGLCKKGVEFLIVPRTSFWWLEYYSEFRNFLNSSYRLMSFAGDCIVFDLRTDTGSK